MITLREIRQAIEKLPPEQIQDLEEWIREIANTAGGVSEPRPAYATVQSGYLSVDEFLKFEEMSTLKHEYIGGELFAMTGATKRHNVITQNMATALHGHLRGGPCRAYVETVKVRFTVRRNEILYYPDVSVACGPQDLGEVFLTDPRLIVEVLSPSTARIDRHEKALNYREIQTLEEYVLVAQHKLEVTVFRRSEDWRAQVMTLPDESAEFRSIELTLPLDRIYEGVLFDTSVTTPTVGS
jgi:Uma2 family endonuclease